MEIKNLYASFKEVFELKDEPLEILQNCEIVPFYFNTSKELRPVDADDAFYKVQPSIAKYPSQLMNNANLLDKFDPNKRGISSMVLKGEIIGLYLPFHFFFKPDRPQEEQIWGIWIMEDAVDWFAGFLKGVDCSPEIKKYLAKVYAVNFAILFHKLEIFIITNEVFEKEHLYKHHFNVLKEDLVNRINQYAHRFAVGKMEKKSAVTRDIDTEILKEAADRFRKLFVPNEDVPFSEVSLLNEIYNRMHQPGRHREKEIWMDINHWFDTQIKITSRDNLFLIRNIPR